MDLAHRQLVRGAPANTGRAHVLLIEPSNGNAEGVAGGGQRGARRVRRRALGGPVPNLLFLELGFTDDLIDVPGLPPTPLVVGESLAVFGSVSSLMVNCPHLRLEQRPVRDGHASNIYPHSTLVQGY